MWNIFWSFGILQKWKKKPTLSPSHFHGWDEPLSFTQKEFISSIRLHICKNLVPPPPKETVRAGLATLGLFDKNKLTLSSTVLVNSSPLKMKYFSPIWKLYMQYIVKCLDGMQGSHDQMNLNQQTITYCLIYGLEIDIEGIVFSYLVHKLQNRKKNRESNICYTRFLSLVFERLLRDKYISNDLTLVKLHTITAASFQKPLASEVIMTLHMLKVAKLYQELEQSLIPPSRESDTKRLKTSDVDSGNSNFAELSHSCMKVDLCMHCAHSDLEEPEKIVKIEEDAEDKSIEILTVEQLLDEIVKQNKAVQETSKTDYELMPEDDMRFVSGFEGADSDDTQGNAVSYFDHTFPYHNASAECLGLPEHLDHICEEVTSLHLKLGTMESSIIHHVSDGIHPLCQLLDDLKAQANSLGKFSLDIQSMQTQLHDFQNLLELVVIVDNTTEGDKNKKAKDPNPAATQGKPRSAEPLVESQGERPANLNVVNKKSAPPASSTKQNKGKDLAKRLGLPPLSELATFGLTAEEKKKKRTELIKEVSITENVQVDEMDRNIIPPSGIMPIQGLVINEPDSGIFLMNGNTDIGFQRENVFKSKTLSRKLLEDMFVSWDGYQLRSDISISCPDKFACKFGSSIKFTYSKGDLTLSFNLCDP
nr:hypothetical protein [Tanacetum cinerariifolium]